MNPILNGLDEGYSPEDILKFISQSIPKLVPKINKAISSGYGIKEIVGFLAKTMPEQNLNGLSESQIQRRNRDVDSKLTQNGLMAATTAIAAPSIIKGAQSALSRALPHSVQSASRGIAGSISPSNGNVQSGNGSPLQPMSGSNQETNPLQTSQQPPSGNIQPNIAQPVAPVQPKGIPNPSEYLDKLGVKDKVDALLQAGNEPEGIAATLNIGNKGKKATGEIDPELVSVIDQYSKETQGQAQTSPTMESPGEKLDVSQKAEGMEQAKPAKNQTVDTPNGIGTIKEIRNGQALVEVDGKLHKVKEEELEASPLPEKDLADLYDDLKSGIEESTDEEMSRMVDFAGYDPNKNTLAFLPYTGSLYVYENITPEDAALLRNVLNVRKTSGENFIGAWKKDSSSPIGSAMSALIKRLQSERGGKGNEYSHKFETVYKSTEPAILASKKKKAEREKEERRKKKNEKA